MHRNELAHVYELRDLLPDPVPTGAYFANFDETLTDWPGKKQHFLDIEAELQGLDASGWSFLKNELAPLLRARHPVRGWQQLFDKLNQTKGYNHLKRLGCTGIRFIRELRIKGKLSPDIEAVDGDRVALCEVKTINISEIEAERRHTGGVRTSTDQLNDLFLGKMRSTIEQAMQQMCAYNTDDRTRRIAFVIINFDDSSHEYADRYAPQLEEFRADYAVSGPEIVLCYRGPFGTGHQTHGG